MKSTTPERLALTAKAQQCKVAANMSDLELRIWNQRKRLALVLRFKKGWSAKTAVDFAWANENLPLK